MNLRSGFRRFAVSSTCAVTLTVALPAALTGAGVASCPGAEPRGFAQSDPITEVARQRYQEGVKAFDAGKFEDARAAFLQAYALKRHPAVLLNIGQSELRSNHPEDAGNHFQQFLREDTNATRDQKDVAQKGIAEAKKKAGFIIVIVDAHGADVSIDGTTVGKAPLFDPVFVKPGKRTVFATYQGHSATTVVDVKPAIASTASLTTGAAGTAPAPVPVPIPVPSTTPAPTPASPTPSATSTSAAPAPTYQPTYAPQPVPTTTTGPDQVSGEREPFLHWYTRKPAAWVGTGVAGVGLLGGIIFSITAGQASAKGKAHIDAITAENAAHPEFNPGNVPPCGSASDGAGGPAFYKTACDLLRTDMSDFHADVAVAATGWVLFGVGTIGTVVYAMLDWYPKKSPAVTGADGKPRPQRSAVIAPRLLAVTPIVTSAHRGIVLGGTF